MNILIRAMARENMTIGIDNDLWEEAKRLVIDLERSFNELIKEVLRDLMEKYKNKLN